MSGSCDGFYASVYRLEIRRSRRDRPCHACRATIRRGDYYANEFAVCDGYATTNVRCGRCQATFEHLSKLCQAHNRKHGDDLAPDPDLMCGLRYEDEWGAVPEEIARLPFLTDAEASELLESKRRVGGE